MTGSEGQQADAVQEESAADLEVDDATLAQAAGGQNLNSTELVYASTFVPFDSSF